MTRQMEAMYIHIVVLFRSIEKHSTLLAGNWVKIDISQFSSYVDEGEKM